MNTVAHIIGDKVGDVVEGAVKKTLGIKDKPKKGGGGIKSMFGGHKEEEKEKDKGGIFSFGHNKKEKVEKDKEEDGGFFSKVFHRHDDDEDEMGKQKKSGFQGLFAEGGGGAMRGGGEGERATGGAMGVGTEGNDEEYKEKEGQTIAVTDRDLLDDLLDVAEEMPKDT